MIAFLTGLFQALPSIRDIFDKLFQLFTKTQAEKQSETAAAEQTEAELLKKTGRPQW